MKIRIKGNSVRFRLTKSEVEALCKNGVFEEKTVFEEDVFKYAVKMDADGNALRAEFKNQKITLWLPEKYGKDWHQNEQVGFENTMKLGNGQELHLLLEKDFVCLDNTTEDQSDNYPNPKAIC